MLVVTPTYNEAGSVERHLRAVLALPSRPDVLVVDDSSPDGTGTLVEQVAAGSGGRVHLLTRPGKAGLGRAYVAGFGWALGADRYDTVVQMDADGSHDPAAVDGLVAATRHADLVLGSRYCPGGRVVGWQRQRELLSRGGNLYARGVLRLPYTDLTGGFKAWRASLLGKIELDTLRSEGYAFQIETTWRAHRAGATVTEVPITFRDRQVGTSKMSRRIAAEAISAVWQMRRG